MPTPAPTQSIGGSQGWRSPFGPIQYHWPSGHCLQSVVVWAVRPRGAGRQWRDSCYAAGPDINLAAVIVDHSRTATWADHDRVADIGGGAAGDRFKTLALIDGEIAESRLNHRGPRRGSPLSPPTLQTPP